MKYLLINKFKFPEASIIMLTGKNPDSNLHYPAVKIRYPFTFVESSGNHIT